MSPIHPLHLDNDSSLPLPPAKEAILQAEEAIEDLDRPASDYLHFPWKAVDALVGGIAPGQLWYAGAFSGHGKTTLLMSLLDELFNQGKTIYFMGLESRPKVLRTQWACRRLGLDAGEVLSGGLSLRADADFIRSRLKQEIKAMSTGEMAERVYLSPRKFVDSEGIEKAANEARAIEADVFMVDHVDHLQGEGRGLWEQSVRANKTLHEMTLEYGLRTMAATQFNMEMIRGNRLGMHSSPQANAVYMGNHKRQIATGMIGLYRPLKFAGLSTEELKGFAKGNGEPQDVCEPNVMAVSVMKHRLFGNHEGRRAFLRVERGKVTDLPEHELPASISGISSRRGVS